MSKTKGGLGPRGLSAIIGAENMSASGLEEKVAVQEIPLGQIERNPFQPRTEFDEAALQELAASIKAQGIIQPLTVRRLAEGQYQLIAGERRLRAARIAGLNSVPAYIRTADDEQMVEMALIENIQREDLNAIEIALSYQRMIDELGLTQDRMAEKVGKERSTITNYLRILKLPAEVQKALRGRSISMGHAKALMSLDERKELMVQAYHEILDKHLSVRQTEALARSLATAPKNTPAAAPQAPSRESLQLAQVEKQLREKLGAAVKLSQQGNGKGELRVSFANTDDLNRILEILDLV